MYFILAAAIIGALLFLALELIIWMPGWLLFFLIGAALVLGSKSSR